MVGFDDNRVPSLATGCPSLYILMARVLTSMVKTRCCHVSFTTAALLEIVAVPDVPLPFSAKSLRLLVCHSFHPNLNPLVERPEPAVAINVLMLNFALGLTQAETENWDPKLVVGKVIFDAPEKVKIPQLVDDENVTFEGVPEMPEVESMTFPEPE